jgi:diaminopimelate epimerase
MEKISFKKMHGLGNDFVIIDNREQQLELSRMNVCAIANRHTGIGCDQLIIVEKPQDKQADAFMRIFNSNGSEVEACGNATRCVASILMAESGYDQAIIETLAGLLDAHTAEGGLISVDMGQAKIDWRDIPLSKAIDTLHLGVGSGPLQDPVGVNMGNPHAVFFVDDADAVDLPQHCTVLERHKLFPKHANISVATVMDTNEIRLRVWERGVGETLACGSGACATLVSASRRSLCGHNALVHLNGGTLRIEWLADNHVMMTGPVATSFSGFVDPAQLD